MRKFYFTFCWINCNNKLNRFGEHFWLCQFEIHFFILPETDVVCREKKEKNNNRKYNWKWISLKFHFNNGIVHLPSNLLSPKQILLKTIWNCTEMVVICQNEKFNCNNSPMGFRRPNPWLVCGYLYFVYLLLPFYGLLESMIGTTISKLC